MVRDTTVLLDERRIFEPSEEIKKRAHVKDWEAEIRELCQLREFPIDEVRFKRTIPRDRRRHAKVDYKRLQAWYNRPALLRFIT